MHHTHIYRITRWVNPPKKDSELEMHRGIFDLRESQITRGDMVCLALYFSDYTLPLLHLPAAFIKERKMGLNDFIQKLVSTPHICQQ